ncbi:MAG TPA: hypothetical protein VHN11_13900, partial [Xanthobacteraceae bacterium]|nr:hypothetical protein [Xanthobacteraceae bacterium]
TKELGVSRAQLARIAERLAGLELGSMATYRDRVIQGVLTLSEAEPDYESLVTEVMKSPFVQRDVEARKASLLAELDAENLQERAKFENLVRATQKQQDRLDKLKEQAEERIRETKVAVRRAFEAAREKEADAIGQFAVLSALLGSFDRPNSESTASGISPSVAAVAPPAFRSEWIAPARLELVKIFRSTGMDEEGARTAAVACDVAKQARIPMLMCGSGARYVSLEVSRSIATMGVCVLDVGIGCCSPEPVREALTRQDADVILVRGVDHSDPWLYAPDLLDSIVQRASSPPAGGDGKVVVLARSSGPAGLALPAELEHLSLKIDLSLQVQTGQVCDPEKLAPLRKKMRSRVEAILQVREDAADIASTLVSLI